MTATIIAGVEGVGKTTFAKKMGHKFKILDLNPEKFMGPGHKFPQDYIDAVLQKRDKYDYILIDAQPSVVNMLNKFDIKYYLVAPDKSLRDEYLQRLIDRGKTQSFVDKLRLKWDEYIEFFEENPTVFKIFTKGGEYLTDLMEYLQPLVE